MKTILAVLICLLLAACSQQSPPSWETLRQVDFGQASITAAFYDPDLGVAVDTQGGIYLTEDGGASWSFVQNAAGSRVGLELLAPDSFWHIGAGGPPRHSWDGGRTWEAITSLPYGGHAEFISFADSSNGWAASTETTVFWITADGGQTWTENPLPTELSTVAALHLRTPTAGYLLDRSGVLYTTADGGHTWQTAFLAVGEGWEIPVLTHSAALRFWNERHGIAVVNLVREGEAQIVVFSTPDAAQTWKRERLPLHPGPLYLSRDASLLTHTDLIDSNCITLLSRNP